MQRIMNFFYKLCRNIICMSDFPEQCLQLIALAESVFRRYLVSRFTKKIKEMDGYFLKLKDFI